MLQGGGKLFLGSGGRYVGAGHFGLLDLGDGVREVLLPLRGGPRSRRHQRARHPSAALARRLAGRGRRTSRRAPTRSSRPARAPRSSSPCRVCPSADFAAAAVAAVRDRAVLRRARRRPARRRRAGAIPLRRPRRFPRRTRRRSRRTGRPAPLDVRHGALHAPGAAEMGDHAGVQCRRLPGIARTSRSLSPAPNAASRRRRTRAGGAAGVHRRAGAAVAHRSARRRHLPADAESASRTRRSRWRCPRSAAASPTLASVRSESDRQRWNLKTP